MSDLRNFFLGRREFKSAQQIIDTVRKSPNFDPTKEDTATGEAVLIFQTSRQQTWLVATKARLYCVLDDIGRSFTRIQWSLPQHDLAAEGKVIVPISTKDKNERTGLLNVGSRRNWLFSKKLFAATGIEDQVRDLIRKQMIS